MKLVFGILIPLLLTPGLVRAEKEGSWESSVGRILQDSKERQPCGEFEADSGLFSKFVFGDRSEVTQVMSIMEIPTRYFVRDKSIYIKTDKGFLELEIADATTLVGQDTWTKGHAYHRATEPAAPCEPYILSEEARLDVQNLYCFMTGMELQGESRFKEAAQRYLECCDAGYAEGCNHFGVLKQLIFQDLGIARRYFRKACDMGFGGGCSNLAYIAKQKGDPRHAKELYEEACKKGHEASCLEGILIEYE